MSIPVSVSQLCAWTGGEVVAGAPTQSFSGTRIDSREIGGGELFVAIVGPNHDAHRFVPDVLAAGAAGALIEGDAIGGEEARDGAFLVRVPDTTRALADLARGQRANFEGPVVGITGSNGKTTTKELCAGILTRRGPTLSTRGNLNNAFGVPLTLLRRAPDDRYAVIEMGMNHRGEIAVLAEIARPTIGVLTNVGSAHIEYLGSREAIAEEKGDLLASLPESGLAVVGRDEPLAWSQAARSPGRVLSFGRGPEADLRASAIRFLDEGAFAFHLETPFGAGELRVPGLAETIVDNALAAAGGAFAAGCDFETVAQGLASHAGVPGRMQPRALPGDIYVIDDSYNANPQSMRNALETLARLETSGRRYVVLGPMGELGPTADEAHRDIGRLAARLGLDGVFALASGDGEAADWIREGAVEADYPRDWIELAKDHASLARGLAARLDKGDRVLVKGSRAAAMERVIEALEEARRT